MKKIALFVSVLFILSSFLSSCSSVTEINGSWKKPGTTAQKYKKIVVIGVFNDLVKRSMLEKSVVNSLTANGFNAVSGSNILPNSLLDTDNDKKLDPDARKKSLKY